MTDATARGTVAEKQGSTEPWGLADIVQRPAPEPPPDQGSMASRDARIAAHEAKLTELDARLSALAWDQMIYNETVGQHAKSLEMLANRQELMRIWQDAATAAQTQQLAEAEHRLAAAKSGMLATALAVAEMFALLRRSGFLDQEAEARLWGGVSAMEKVLPADEQAAYANAVQHIRAASGEAPVPPPATKH